MSHYFLKTLYHYPSFPHLVTWFFLFIFIKLCNILNPLRISCMHIFWSYWPPINPNPSWIYHSFQLHVFFLSNTLPSQTFAAYTWVWDHLLKHDQPIKGHTPKENWLLLSSSSHQLSIAHELLPSPCWNAGAILFMEPLICFSTSTIRDSLLMRQN